MMNPRQYIKTLSAVLLGFLLIWIGVTGRLGSLLGALITPDFMVDGSASTGASTQWPPFGPLGPLGAGQLSDRQVAQYAYNAGITTNQPLAYATAIALAESGGNSNASNPSGAS